MAFNEASKLMEWRLQQEQLPALKDTGDKLVVVLKQHRFYKQLCIELYQAQTTHTGKLKNPLTFVNPLDLTCKTESPAELRFFAGIARFQNNATLHQSYQDLEGLRAVLDNPLKLDFYSHNKDISENIVAAALDPVETGKPTDAISILVNKKSHQYEIQPQLVIDGIAYNLSQVKTTFDYFILANKTLHLVNDFIAVQVLQLFPVGKAGIHIHENKFNDFRQTVLNKLGDKIPIHYSFITAATNEQAAALRANTTAQKFIYLSELSDFVIIDPVMRYGEVDIPIRTKRLVYANDAKGKEFTIQRDDAAEINFTALLMQQHALFEEQVDNDLPYFYLHRKRFLQEAWFLDAFETWQQAGITVLGFNKLKNNKLNGNKAKITIRITSGTNWFNTNLELQYGKQKASLKQLQQALRNQHKYVQLGDGTHGILPAEWLERFANYFNAGELVEGELVIPKMKFSELEELYDAADLDNEVKQELALYHCAFDKLEEIPQVEAPETLQTTLRPYQQHGLNWLSFLAEHHLGGCLADDMGLGKTVQVIALLLMQQQKTSRNTNLLVVPTSLVFNWQAELQKFAPALRVFTIENSKRPKDLRAFDNYHIVLISYGILVTAISYLRHYVFNYVIADESQQAKNIDSQRYRALRLLQGQNRLAVTGTPIENNVFDLYAQMSFVNPGLLGNQTYFRDTYAIPIDKFKNAKRALELQQKVAPFMLRRTKQQVATELPQKTEMILYCPMDEGQRKVYDAYEKEFRESVEAETEDEMKKNSMRVLRGLTRLRQICNSPLLLEDEKLYTDGAAKIDVLMEQIESKSSRHKILVFSQFVAMLELIKKELTNRGISFEWLSGSTKDRERVVNNFQQNLEVRVFLISLKAGGTGLNLTEADYIYLVDPWWNPAVENQAIDRAYRIGQQKPVVAVRLICPDTLEEKIMQLQASKKALSDTVVKSDAAIFKAISREEVLGLVRR